MVWLIGVTAAVLLAVIAIVVICLWEWAHDAGGDITLYDIYHHDIIRGIPHPVDLMGVEKPRSDKWPTVRKHHLTEEPKCMWCGGTEKLQVHHIMAFHLDPSKELDDSNLITLCEEPVMDCHLHHGHPVLSPNGIVLEFNFRTGINPHVRQDCVDHHVEMKLGLEQGFENTPG